MVAVRFDRIVLFESLEDDSNFLVAEKQVMLARLGHVGRLLRQLSTLFGSGGTDKVGCMLYNVDYRDRKRAELGRPITRRLVWTGVGRSIKGTYWLDRR